MIILNRQPIMIFFNRVVYVFKILVLSKHAFDFLQKRINNVFKKHDFWDSFIHCDNVTD